jgi:predicted glycogen debranching enzyme
MTAAGRRILGNLQRATELEWMVTNGLGGFAASSLANINTRRYHGLLVAAARPPVERVVLVSRLEETLLFDDQEIHLSTFLRGREVAYPSGYLFLEAFERQPIPTWTYQIQDMLLIKSVFMVYGQNTTVITYKLMATHRAVELRLRPHLLFRDFHGNTHQNPGFADPGTIEAHGWSLQPFANSPTLFAAWDRGTFVADPTWNCQIFLPAEEARGLNPLDDEYSNGYLRVSALAGSVSLVFSDQPIPSFNPIDLRKREEIRLQTIADSMQAEDPFLRDLLLAADQFIVTRHSTDSKTIIAGYPWFSDWGRDSLISLPGLTLVPGRFDDARSILGTFARTVKDGLVANCFPDQGSEAMYNSVDAALWFFFAAYKFIEYTDDYTFVRESLRPAMIAIIDAYRNGTRFRIGMDPDDGLISAGEAGVQLTWMDAKVNDWVVTPRHGKAVEINALWYKRVVHPCHARGKVRRGGARVARVGPARPPFLHPSLPALRRRVSQ